MELIKIFFNTFKMAQRITKRGFEKYQNTTTNTVMIDQRISIYMYKSLNYCIVECRTLLMFKLHCIRSIIAENSHLSFKYRISNNNNNNNIFRLNTSI